MNESEKRRKQLLAQARDMYSDKHTPPAIHPRYQSLYARLYQDSGYERPMEKGTFGIRAFICLLLFALFVSADYKGSKVATVSSEKVVKQIEATFEPEDVKQVWKDLSSMKL